MRFNDLLKQAVDAGASDVHLHVPLPVMMRVSGRLRPMNDVPLTPRATEALVDLMCNEQQRAQFAAKQQIDLAYSVPGLGRFRVNLFRQRGSVSAVLRIINSDEKALQVVNLPQETIDYFKNQEKGLVLVTGPTGSGKSTTLARILDEINATHAKMIVTVEDPIEYLHRAKRSIVVQRELGMDAPSFSEALVAAMRQDPDVIMIGEIRDHETAHIAVQAALTGHLVLSTLHTNDAPSSITRLVNIGLEPFLVGAAINGVLAQRLVRRLCVHCKQQARPSEERAEYLQMQGMDPDGVFVAVGCDRCRGSGYSGRVGIYELLTVDDQLRDVIARNPNVAEFRRMCIERGMVTLREDGMRKVAKGLTTVEEVLRVTEAH